MVSAIFIPLLAIGETVGTFIPPLKGVGFLVPTR